MPVIEVKNLVHDYGSFRAVNGISFSIEEGEIFGFLGPNGAGKSTTINILCTLLRPTSGEARIVGYDVTAEPAEVRQNIGIIFQDPSLDDRLTAEENLVFHTMLYHVPRSERQARIDSVLEMVGLRDNRNQLVKTFSGGMKRRLEIARGLLHRPRLLILDEPTLGLDPQTRNTIWKYLLFLRDRYGMTIFMTTHYMEEAENCHRIAIIDHGEIIALDTPSVLKQGIGSERVTLVTADNRRALAGLSQKFNIEAWELDGSVVFDMPEAENTLAGVLTSLDVDIKKVSLRSPTLEDVFLELTGRGIRDYSVSDVERMRGKVRRRRMR